VRANGEQRHIGYYPDEAAAARAYDRGALELKGTGARTNFPPADYVQGGAGTAHGVEAGEAAAGGGMGPQAAPPTQLPQQQGLGQAGHAAAGGGPRSPRAAAAVSGAGTQAAPPILLPQQRGRGRGAVAGVGEGRAAPAEPCFLRAGYPQGGAEMAAAGQGAGTQAAPPSQLPQQQAVAAPGGAGSPVAAPPVGPHPAAPTAPAPTCPPPPALAPSPPPSAKKPSRYRGVSWHSGSQRWQVRRWGEGGVGVM
jgi:hypothetical protein